LLITLQQFRKCASGNDYSKFHDHDPGSTSCLHPVTQALIHYPPYEQCTHGTVTEKRKAALKKCVGNVKNLLLAHPPQCEHAFAYTVFESAFLYVLLLLSCVMHTSWCYDEPTHEDVAGNDSKDEVDAELLKMEKRRKKQSKWGNDMLNDGSDTR
jgi:hypothetical protein